MDSDEDENTAAKKEYKAENIPPISIANERRVMVKLKQHCVDALK